MNFFGIIIPGNNQKSKNILKLNLIKLLLNIQQFIFSKSIKASATKISHSITLDQNNMKKQNRNIFAYVRPSQQDGRLSHNSSKLNSKSHNNLTGHKHQYSKGHETQLGSSQIYQQIVEQMEPEHYEYLNKLVDRSSKLQQKQKKRKQILNIKKDQNFNHMNQNQFTILNKQDQNQKEKQQKMLNCHERIKSYGNILISSPKNNKQVHSCVQSKQKQNGRLSAKIYSNQNSPKNKKQHKEIRSSYRQSRQNSQSRQFLSSLDNYINDLSIQTSNDNNTFQERKTISKSRFKKSQKNKLNKSQSNNNILEHLEQAYNQVESLRMSNRILQRQNTELKKKNIHNKDKMHQMLEHIHYVSNQLEQQRYERSKMDEFFREIQGKIMAMRPQRKTIGRMQTIQQYFLSETTEQDQQFETQENLSSELEFDMMNFYENPKKLIKNNSIQHNSIMKKKLKLVPPRNNVPDKNNRNYIRNFSKDQMAQILAERFNYQYDQMAHSYVEDENSDPL